MIYTLGIVVDMQMVINATAAITFGGVMWKYLRKLHKLVIRVNKFVTEHDLLVERVNVMWDKYMDTWKFLRDRATEEVIGKKLAKHESPLSIDTLPNREKILSAYLPLLPEIEQVIDSAGGDLSQDPDDVVLFEAIGTKLGEKLHQTVCDAVGVDRGGCVSLALAVARHHRKLHSSA